uniref:cellulose 1,4-beta-cellobiosidase (non-reducing end) n=1 Tax=Arcella intermedia TaxID=1963864 RepID=A0A6B2L439_9EUKA|eukprot:TRINITY_DN7573_c0_g1_i1.p1 TRINITY_DN7573_c0_g1~~TRINITY_DN7573_c0_g1_i1.p1  ORF type:complete len:452 (+),score=9.47 TRINITY_DN7573_c0_g1_i1:27-1382(+)
MISAVVFVVCFAWAYAQNVGTLTAENHPPLTWSQCTSSGCQPVSGAVVMDANWRWTHSTSSATNCYTGNTWDQALCPDPQTCTRNCAIDGADYAGTYGVTTAGNALNIRFVTQGPYSKNIGSRLYLLSTDTQYQLFHLKNREFTFDVDLSNLPCGLNGALYFVAMDADGGMGRFPSNHAGAKFGTGYCDAQCPHDLKWINGEANVLDWKPSPNDPNSGTGFYGTCCVEMDIWEANSQATAVTPHSCVVKGQYRCNGTQCGDGTNRYAGVCDKDGCDFNSYRMGVEGFFGSRMTVDTTQAFTVVTQFVTADGTDGAPLTEIRRFYRQNGRTIPNSAANFTGMAPYSSISTAFCEDQKKLFGDPDDFARKGGLAAVGEQLDRGMVLVMSLWDDHEVYMLWLDSDYPTTKDPSTPGVPRGPCPTSSGRPSDVESKYPNSNVVFSNIKFGTIGST